MLTHKLERNKELGPDFKELISCLNLHVHSVKNASKHVRTRHVSSSDLPLTNSHQELVSGQARNLNYIPFEISIFFDGGVLWYLVLKRLHFLNRSVVSSFPTFK
jgi:hypothetical protein